MIADAAQYVDGIRRDAGPLDLDEARQRARDDRGFVWIVLRDPPLEELEAVGRGFALPPLAVEDAHEGHQRPKLERYLQDLFWVVKTASYDPKRQELGVGEIGIFLGPRHAVVVCRDVPDGTIEGARERLDEHPDLVGEGPMAGAWAVLDEVIDAYEPVIDRLGDDLDATEQSVFERGLDQGGRIYLETRRATRLVRTLHPLVGIFDALEEDDPPMIPRHLRARFRDVGDHVRRLDEEAVMLAEALDRLLDVNLAGVTVRQNQVVQKVSGWAAIAAVPTIMTGIYGMNFDHMPELRWQLGYPLVVALMVVVVVGLRRYFRAVGWF